MKVVLSTCIFAAVAMVVAGAPTLSEGVLPEEQHVPLIDTQEYESQREKRSSYGPTYLSPCAAAAAPPAIPNIAPYHHIAPLNAPYPIPHGYGYGIPHYRADDQMGEEEMMSFSDMDMMEHMPMARYGAYAPAPAAHIGIPGFGSIGGQLIAPAPQGPAFGVFPKANIGGCNVPLLFSCSPSIVPGKIVKGQPQYLYNNPSGVASTAIVSPASGSAVNVYRGVDDHPHQESSERHEEQSAHEHMAATSDVTHAASVH